MVYIEPRAIWGARYRNGDVELTGLATEVFGHHTVTTHLPASATVGQERVQMLWIEKIGYERFGVGISYNVVIFPSGRAYEGVSWHRRGTHTGGRNSTARSICFAGNYDGDLPATPAAIETAAAIYAHGRGRWWTRTAPLRGHRDVRGTSCPGRHIYSRLSTIAARAVQLVADGQVIGGTVPTPPAGRPGPNPLEPIEETDMPASVAVRHPNGSIALAGDDGTFIPLSTESELESLKATGALRLHGGPLGTLQLPDGLIWDLRARIGFRKAVQGEQDPAKVAATITATLVPAVLDALPPSAGLTVAQVQAAAETAIRSVLRSV